jgi:hypothetical protein
MREINQHSAGEGYKFSALFSSEEPQAEEALMSDDARSARSTS